ncbi:hypothetical protein [Nonomuraea basaltis]|uniref:hypothetical protein n=1 Tax=Nonomuraea basaltis TaxID=2495887 RepID=UPI00110C6D81|nr:hypothetical protein [Nonomuraea basaltis]TMR97881.1 hypothetical protein EJK15_15355 [Nonomuraea basaltis]
MTSSPSTNMNVTPYTPVTARGAARRLEREPCTIRKWASRYYARVLGRAGRETVYDYADLATIEWCIWAGHPFTRHAGGPRRATRRPPSRRSMTVK